MPANVREVVSAAIGLAVLDSSRGVIYRHYFLGALSHGEGEVAGSAVKLQDTILVIKLAPPEELADKSAVALPVYLGEDFSIDFQLQAAFQINGHCPLTPGSTPTAAEENEPQHFPVRVKKTGAGTVIVQGEISLYFTCQNDPFVLVAAYDLDLSDRGLQFWEPFSGVGYIALHLRVGNNAGVDFNQIMGESSVKAELLAVGVEADAAAVMVFLRRRKDGKQLESVKFSYAR